ncbi:DUF2849 domain-containing protein [Sinisalibacter aestuarii]|uniref:DUF2849 domain-containing protein n=1 Tax=Sinisalibacter aestuarii TaxID=2949426 RepID=A0ABQ5LYI7_9RHOB|nr:DUF2849 domain-containing protein [Sinisalibacter aestuarii]GKY89470.1 hypothetical protein STA1M1_33390 [Sinisalibacter aestuarii]
MAKAFHPGFVSANDLATGRVIYRTAEGRWVQAPEQAEFITDAGAAAARLSAAEAEGHIAVGPYLAPARPGLRGPEPAHFRETFRASGPSAPARVSWGADHA